MQKAYKKTHLFKQSLRSKLALHCVQRNGLQAFTFLGSTRTESSVLTPEVLLQFSLPSSTTVSDSTLKKYRKHNLLLFGLVNGSVLPKIWIISYERTKKILQFLQHINKVESWAGLQLYLKKVNRWRKETKADGQSQQLIHNADKGEFLMTYCWGSFVRTCGAISAKGCEFMENELCPGWEM